MSEPMTELPRNRRLALLGHGIAENLKTGREDYLEAIERGFAAHLVDAESPAAAPVWLFTCSRPQAFGIAEEMRVGAIQYWAKIALAAEQQAEADGRAAKAKSGAQGEGGSDG